MWMPESKIRVNLPVFVLSALEVAVMVTMTLGSFVWSGKFLGARKAAVEAEVVPVLAIGVSVPTAGSPLAGLVDWPTAAAEGAGLGTAGAGCRCGAEWVGEHAIDAAPAVTHAHNESARSY